MGQLSERKEAPLERHLGICSNKYQKKGFLLKFTNRGIAEHSQMFLRSSLKHPYFKWLSQ